MLKLIVTFALSFVFAHSTLAAEIVVDASNKFQTIEGFGTCLISWDPKMTRWYETDAAQKAFADDLRLNILRCNLWGDGTVGPTEDWRQISHKDPAFAKSDPRTPIFINFAKAIRKINPDVKIIGSVWSPPKWMKESGKITGVRSDAITATEYVSKNGPVNDRVKREYYPHFAKWVVEMVKHYEANGVPLYAISPANEPQFTQTFESCTWTVPDLITIVKLIGKQLEEEKLGHVKIFAMESMTGFNWQGGPNRAFVRAIEQDAEAKKYLYAFATHGYVDGFAADQGRDSAKQFWDLIKDAGKPYWMTEGGTGRHDWNAVIGPKGVAAGLHNSLVAGNVSAWVPWQFAGPGGDGEHALRDTAGPTKKTWVVRQYSRYIPAGSVRISADPAYADVNVSAYAHPKDNGVTIVLTNPSSDAKTVELKLDGVKATRFNVVRTSGNEDGADLKPAEAKSGKLTIDLPAQSVTTLTTVK